jgi:cytochrome c oxidase subunit II
MPKLLRKVALTCALLAATALVFAGAAVAGNGGIAPVDARSPNADQIDDAYWLILGFTGAIFILVETALIVFIVRFRSRGRPREVEGPQIRGHTRLELIWTAIPVLILAAIASFVFYKLPGIKNVPAARAGDEHVNVKVEGKQYYWQFTYPNGAISIDRLWAPAGRVVTLDITAEDVIHSWWIPALGGKFDAIPGKTNQTWFRARRGTYSGRCAEFCGLIHASMLAEVRAVSETEYRKTVAGLKSVDELGAQEYEGVCAKCHGFQGQGGIGPALKTNPLITDRQGLEPLIRSGRGQMPPVAKSWSDEQVGALVGYLRKRISQTGGASGG